MNYLPYILLFNIIRCAFTKETLFPGRLEGSGGFKRPCCKLACGYVHLDLALNLWKSETRPGLTKSWQCFTVTHNRCKFISTVYQLIFYLVFDIVYTLFWLLNLAIYWKFDHCILYIWCTRVFGHIGQYLKVWADAMGLHTYHRWYDTQST